MRLPVISLILILVVLVLSGCRTYGGYGSEEALYRQIERLVDRFEEDLSRARGDLAALEQITAENPEVREIAVQYASLIEGQEAILDEHRGLLADVSPGSSYRSLHHAHGAILSSHRTMQLQQEGLLRQLSEAAAPDTARTGETVRPYALIPPFYLRISEATGATTASEIIRRARAEQPGADTAPEPGAAAVDGEADAGDQGESPEEDVSTDAVESEGAVNIGDEP